MGYIALSLYVLGMIAPLTLFTTDKKGIEFDDVLETLLWPVVMPLLLIAAWWNE